MGILDEFDTHNSGFDIATRVIMQGKKIYDASERKFDDQGNLIVRENKSQTTEAAVETIPINVFSNDKIIPKKKPKIKEQHKITQRPVVFRFEDLNKDLRFRCIDISENNIGFLFLFENEDSLNYVPDVGSSFEISLNNQDFIPVYFPGTLFNVGERVILVVIKSNN